MYTTKGTTPQVAVVSTSAAQPLPSSTTTEPLTYWTDARSSTMARPSPTVSNCGLVIVQVENSPRQFEENRTFYHEPQSLTNWSNITLDNRYAKFLETLNFSHTQFFFQDISLGFYKHASTISSSCHPRRAWHSPNCGSRRNHRRRRRRLPNLAGIRHQSSQHLIPTSQ